LLIRHADASSAPKRRSEELVAATVKAAVGRLRPCDQRIDLTAAALHARRNEGSGGTRSQVRVEGNINLLAALRDAGVRRYLLQSSGFWLSVASPGAS
jgi:hypothetical protein